MIGTTLRAADRIGAWKARWGIGRMSYLVPPGLYAVGSPSPADPVLVTANYKMSYDLVRRELGGRNVWLLVLQTFGINVWCAAGKGTFGTGELIERIAATRLAQAVSHRTLVLPLLGAPGVAAHEVRAATGFEVRYAGARAEDIPRLLDSGLQTTRQMRELTFTLRERLALAPIELVIALKGSLWIAPLIALASGWRGGAFAPAAAVPAVVAYLGAVVAGTVVTPLLLPWLPARSFAVKGALVGALWAVAVLAATGWRGAAAAAAAVLIVVVSAFLGLNFTGATPFTSLSGVRKEMRVTMPLMACGLAAGLALWAAAALL